MRDFCIRLGERLIEAGYKVISGMGLNIGDSVVKGALMKLYEKGISSTEPYLTVRPFPRALSSGGEATFNRRYRQSMIEKCGFAVFVAGTSRSHAESAGVLEEFEIAKQLGKIPIPVGATGFAARRIWESLQPDWAAAYHNVIDYELFQSLNDTSLDNERLLQSVLAVIQKVAADDRA